MSSFVLSLLRCKSQYTGQAINKPMRGGAPVWKTYQIKHRNFHHTLVKVSRAILDDLDGNNLLRLEVLAFDDLAKSTLAQHIENEVSIPAEIGCESEGATSLREGFSNCNDALVASFLGAQNVIHVEDIIAVLVVVAIVLGALAGLC